MEIYIEPTDPAKILEKKYGHFGFLVSFEQGTHWGWRLGYGVFVLWSLITAVRLCWVERRSSVDTDSPHAQQATDNVLDIKQDIDSTDSEIKRA